MRRKKSDSSLDPFKLDIRIINDSISNELLDKLFKNIRFISCPNKLLKGDCWVRGNDSTIYTSIKIGNDRDRAHRISYELFNNKKLRQFGLHHCDVKACINPDHLYDGNNKDNSKDIRARLVKVDLHKHIGLKKLKKQYKEKLIFDAKFKGDLSRGLIQIKSSKKIEDDLQERMKKLCY